MMAVYLDNARNGFGRMVMCHMIADTEDELHAMAERIGLRREWYQGDASTPHYDVSLSRRALAVRHGAIVCERREFVRIIQAKREREHR
jgi:Protein of unknown function (DUF4031)